MDQWMTSLNTWMNHVNTDPQGFKPVAIGVGASIALGVCLYCVEQGMKKLLGIRKMRKRARLSKEVCEIIEDHFVDGLSEAIDSGRLKIDEARMIYAKVAHLGFWGLHPRKFTPKKSAEDLEALKEQLRAKRDARKNSKAEISTSKAISKLMDGLEAESAA